ncbi:MAG TPA: nucleotidyltransferase domain-containing protein [Verrucomicrobiae bacterium]|nr:nucleotidyltransferase domain-containing protein [Verrucomicrobiae bacterium]
MGLGRNEGAKAIYARHNGRNCTVSAYTVWLNVKQLSVQQRELVSSLAKQLGEIQGIKAVVLGGSHARGRAQPGSDIDLGLLYSEAVPFSIQSVRKLAESVNDTSRPVVTSFYEWGRWVNGGAWLTIGGQRVDFIYRSLEQVEQVIAEAEAGRYELDHNQQPPFGFFSGTYLGEIAVCVPLVDLEKRLGLLKRKVADYPTSLRQAVIQDYLWLAEFGLTAFAPKFATRSDTYGTAACLTRAVNHLVLVLFALNRKYLINDKTALEEIAEFERAPEKIELRVQRTLGHLGSTATELASAVESVAQLFQETVDLTDGLYQPRYALRKRE